MTDVPVVQSHIFKKCAGYAQYRSLSSTKSENKEAENVPPSPSLPRNSHKSPSAACADMDTEHTEGNVPDGACICFSIAQDFFLYHACH